ncbi:helix-turn-helix domain-containing protein [Bacteroidota bacterium]
MAEISTIYKAIRFIENNLKEDICVSDVANEVCYSIYHFCRVFNKTTHQTPYDYIIKRRLTDSAIEIKNTSKKIIDIAFDFQFNSPENFSRAFKKFLSIQPNQYRLNNENDTRQLFHPISQEYLYFIENLSISKPEIIFKESFKISGIMSLLNESISESDIWNTSLNEIQANKKSDLIGLYQYNQLNNNNSIYYIAGIDSNNAEKSHQLITKTIPANTYLKISYKGKIDNLSFLKYYSYHSVIPKIEYNIKDQFELCRYKNFSSISYQNINEIQLYIPLKKSE